MIGLSNPDVKPRAGQKVARADSFAQSRRHPAIRWDDCVTWVYHGLRLALAGVFIYAGVVKLLDPRTFAHAIAQYDLVPEALLPMVAIGLPALELLAGAGLVLEVRGSLTVIAVLLVVFLVVLGYAVWQDLDIDCGCFTAEDLEGIQSVKVAFWRDLIMIGATLFLFRRRWRRSPQSLWIARLKILLKGETT
jgi:uncharacterized membrane protein YphA (DoxX/SURF4 family)